ncbi:hypothetical protein BACEGG_01222 [Bacteroides eggerthii DSM 20697]|nr:hypothetical protein BACEGG_01222 [Bacteroides eggerthii DSM 20697]
MIYISTCTLVCVFSCIFKTVEETDILCKSRFYVYADFKE